MGNNYQILKPLIDSSKQIIELQKSKLDTFSTKDFPNQTSYDLISLMQEICEKTSNFLLKLEEEFKKAKTNEDFEEIESDLIQITQYLGWLSATAIDTIELSTRDRVSQDSIFLLNYFTKPFSKNSRFILIPTHEHNFMIAAWGEMFKKILELLDVELGSLKISPTIFSIISFPSIFKDNLVAHSSLGHEIGHFIISKYSLADIFTPWIILDSTLMNQVVEKEMSKIKSGRNKEQTAFQPAAIKFFTNKRIRENISKGIEELVSDLIGLKILGPVFLFASTEFLLTDTPKFFAGQEHPPPAFRLKILIDEFKSKNYLSKILTHQNKLKQTVEGLVKIIEDFITPFEISKYELEYQIQLKAWMKIVPQLTKLVDDTINKIEKLGYAPNSFGTETSTLIDKLKQLIPPCEIEQTKPANLVSILNAGMIFKLTHEEFLSKPPENIGSTIDSLVIRAAHQSEIQRNVQLAMEKENHGKK